MNVKLNPCPVPGCPRNRQITSNFGVCAHHTEQFAGISYFLQQAQREVEQNQRKAQRSGIRPGEKVTPSGIILP